MGGKKMKFAASVITIALLLLFPALAADNSVYQSNSQQSNGAGYSSAIYQTSSNTAMVIGNGNYVSQYNGLNSENAASFGTINQQAANDIIANGEQNTAIQNNYADAYLYGELDGIFQTQNNLGAITGSMNQMDQSNNAYAQTYANNSANDTLDYSGPNINQNQSNSGVQDGSSNNLKQWNNEDAGIFSYSETFANSNANAYANDYANTLASVKVAGLIEPITINQNQANNAAQAGWGNSQQQSNSAETAIDSSISAIAYSSANASANSDKVISGNATATSDSAANASTTVKSLTINQNQANSAIQTGNISSADQNNYANANIHADVHALSYSSASPHAQASAAYANADADSDSVAFADAYLDSQYIEQNQLNDALQTGGYNHVFQRNNAYDNINVTAISEANAATSPYARAHSYYNWSGANADALGNAYSSAQSRIGANVLSDSQSNTVTQIGNFNQIDQSNDANINVFFNNASYREDRYDPFVDVDQPDNAYANAEYDSFAHSVVDFSADNNVANTQRNLGLMLSQSDTLNENNNANLDIPGTSFVDVNVTEENSVTTA